MEFITNLNITLLGLVKLGLTIFMLVYVVFATVIMRQTKLMEETLEVDFDKFIHLVAQVHLGASIVVLLIALIFL